MRAALIAVMLVVVITPAAATPGQQLADANAAFRAGEFVKAEPLYNDLLYPPPPKLSSPDDQASAYIALGVCRLENGDEAGARHEFENALFLDANRQLDPVLITNKAAIRLFDDTKTDIKVRAERDAARKQHVEDIERQRKFLASLVVYEQHTYGLNFVPFGIGQYQNKQYFKSVLFAGSEALTGFASLGIWGYLVNKYGINNQHLHVDNNEAQSIRLLQQVEIGSGVAFLALAVYGVIDATRHFQPQTRVKADDSLIPPELRDKPARKPGNPTSLRDRVHLAPMITPTGVGLGLGWEN